MLLYQKIATYAKKGIATYVMWSHNNDLQDTFAKLERVRLDNFESKRKTIGFECSWPWDPGLVTRRE